MKQDYLSRLRRAARWMLLQEDAAEVIADYEELARGRTDEELLRDLGAPEDAVRQLVERKPFGRWLRFFIAMALCAAVPAAFSLLHIHPVFRYYYYELPIIGFLLAMWYWRPDRERPRAPLPKGLLPAMLALLLAASAAAGILWRVSIYALHPSEEFPEWLYGWWDDLVAWLCVLLVAVSICGLARARMYGRRWRVLYVLALASLALILAMCRSVASLDLSGLDAEQWRAYAVEWGIVAATGLICTGVSLC